MTALSQEALDQLFTKARTHRDWADKPVSDDTLRQIYDLAKWGPTSGNCSPLRVVFLRSKETKDKLVPALMPVNVPRVAGAPLVAIFAEDREFYEQLPRLAPHADVRSMFIGNGPLIESTAFRNSSLQAAYFMLAARSLGLDVGPMSGFDNAKLDDAFFKDTKWRSNFICCMGYGDPSKLFPRAPRLEFDEACKIM